MDTVTLDDLVLCDKIFEENFEEMHDKTGSHDVVIIREWHGYG